MLYIISFMLKHYPPSMYAINRIDKQCYLFNFFLIEARLIFIIKTELYMNLD